MDGKPLATNGCRGNPASAMYFSTSLELQPTSGLILIRSPSASNSGRVARIVALETLTPGDPGVKSFHRLGEGANLADIAAAVRIAHEQKFLRVLLRHGLRLRLGDDDVGQSQTRDEVVAIGERLGEVLAGVDEDHGRRRVDLRHHVQERRGVRAEARHERDAAGIKILDREPQERRWP